MFCGYCGASLKGSPATQDVPSQRMPDGGIPGLPVVDRVRSSLQNITFEDFTDIKIDMNKILRDPLNQLIGPAGGVLLLISLFLTWVSFHVTYYNDYLDISNNRYYNYNLFNVDSRMGWIACITALVSIGSIFLARKNARNLLKIGMGCVALITVIIGLLIYVPYYSHVPLAHPNATIQAGVYVYIIAVIIIIYGGIRGLKK